MERPLLWIFFNLFVLAMLAIDLGVFHRHAHKVSLREALAWSVVWISLALLFNLGIYYYWGTEKALEFLAGYLIEKSLSVDNIFCLPDDLLVFCRARRLPAPGAVLGNFGRVDHARALHRGRRSAPDSISLDDIHIWRLSRLHRNQNVACRRRKASPRKKPGGTSAAARHASEQ